MGKSPPCLVLDGGCFVIEIARMCFYLTGTRAVVLMPLWRGWMETAGCVPPGGAERERERESGTFLWYIGNNHTVLRVAVSLRE